MYGWLRRRPLLGQYATLVHELEIEDERAYRNYMRMSPQLFQEICQRIGPRIHHGNQCVREPLEDALKLAFTIRYMATGERYQSLQYNFRVHRTTLGYWIPRVCQAIIDEYGDEFFKCPTTEAEWLQVEEGFRNTWDMPHGLGAIDGKHIAIRCPRRGGSLYYNYKHFHSIVLLAMVDSQYRFLWANIGRTGCASDAQVWEQCDLLHKIKNNRIRRPGRAPIEQGGRLLEYFFLGDDAFALKTYLMKPYGSLHLAHSKKIYNYRISRARRVVENAFGLLVQRWQCLLATQQQQPQVVTTISTACLVLHNLMRTRYPGVGRNHIDREDQQHRVIPGAWRDMALLTDLPPIRAAARATAEAKEMREYLEQYFNTVGAVPWQDDMVGLGRAAVIRRQLQQQQQQQPGRR